VAGSPRCQENLIRFRLKGLEFFQYVLFCDFADGALINYVFERAAPLFQNVRVLLGELASDLLGCLGESFQVDVFALGLKNCNKEQLVLCNRHAHGFLFLPIILR
jgi:hypothetical protein